MTRRVKILCSESALHLFRPKITLVTELVLSKRGFLKPHKHSNQSETSTTMKEKTGETMDEIIG
jgi:hypothetical protein